MEPVTTAALLAGGASLAGGAWANMTNLSESKRAREWAAVMAGSEVQRRMIDMKAAGLNPILAAGGAASTPGPATASVDDAIGPAVSSAMAARAQHKEFQLMDQQIAKTSAEGWRARSEANVAERADRADQARWKMYFDERGQPTEKFGELIRSEHDSKIASSARQISDAQLAKFSVPEQQAIGRMWEELGGAGKGAAQFLLPLLSTLIQARPRR